MPVVSTESSDALSCAVGALRAGMAVVVPTDTVYGLAALARDARGVAAIFALKARPQEVALPVLVANLDQALTLASDRDRLSLLGGAFWPGALTVVVERAPGIALALGGDPATIGLRCPDAEFVRLLAAEVGPLAVTSANRHGDEPCTTVAQVREIFGDEHLIVDGGTRDAPVSTVVSLVGGRVELLRVGALRLDELSDALGESRPLG